MDSEDKSDRRGLHQIVRETWLGVLGVISSAEGEVQKTTTRILESLGIAEEGRGSLGAELMARVRRNREEFERRIDEGVRSYVGRLRAPIDHELATLRARIERLQARLDERRRNKQDG